MGKRVMKGEAAASPYFELHREGPVHWRAWDEKVLEEARRGDSLIFLHIGYSACHWCGVMNRTTFLDETVAHLLNEHYIPVIVDREVRPDLDAVYMRCCQFLTQGGGWPLNLILTPEEAPIWAGGFLTAGDTDDRQGMVSVLETGLYLWENKREQARKMGSDIVREMRIAAKERTAKEAAKGPSAVALLTPRFDAQHGGFGSAPKFLNALYLLSLLSLCETPDVDPIAEEMLRDTLDAMRKGEIFDRVNGGIFRYAQTRDWGSPHYEKMLRDQALMACVYADAGLLLKDAFYTETAGKILTYAAKHLQSPEGLFYTAQSADEDYYRNPDGKRNPPRDRMIRLSTNAMMVIAFARYGLAASAENALQRAELLMKDLTAAMTDENGVTQSSVYEGLFLGEAYLEDLADTAYALLELYGITFRTAYLHAACQVAEQIEDLFADTMEGGYFLRRTTDSRLILEEKPFMDSDHLPANAVLLKLFHRLYALTGDAVWEKREESLKRYLRQAIAMYGTEAVYASEMLHACALPMPKLDVSCADKEALTEFYEWLSDRPAFRRQCAITVTRETGKTQYVLCGQDRCLAPVDSLFMLEEAAKEAGMRI